jgi:type VI secretion system protein ImpM
MNKNPPGWYGKLPTLGDFASRRLEPDFIECWDGWLAAGMLALREQDEAGWLEAYLLGPSWRFLLMPGVLPGALGHQAWAGVLMPSVDRVGRYFPFTLVLPLGSAPASTAQMTALWHWLGRLDELAADALHEDWSPEQLEQELAGMAGPSLQAPPADSGQLDAATQIGIEAQALWRQAAVGRAYWFTASEDVAQRCRVDAGLPAALALLRKR